MNELITVNYDENNDRPTVMGRDLHKALGIKTEYKKWFDRMTEYGFTENEDYVKVTQKCLTSSTGQNITDHQLTIDMAKEICMIQRSEKGKQFRQYFIEVEKRWNDPEAIMARALKIANNKIGLLEGTVKEQEEKIEILDNENKILSSEVLEWADRKLINAIVRRYASKACGGNFANAWTNFKKELLYKYGINLNSRITHYLNEKGKKTKPSTLKMLTDDEVIDALKTIVSLCRESGVEIGDLLKKYEKRFNYMTL